MSSPPLPSRRLAGTFAEVRLAVKIVGRDHRERGGEIEVAAIEDDRPQLVDAHLDLAVEPQAHQAKGSEKVGRTRPCLRKGPVTA